MAVQRFDSIISARSVGAADVEKLSQSFDKLSASLDNSGKKSEQTKAKFDNFAESVKDGIQNPLEAAGNAAGGFLKTLGPMGTAIGVAAAATGVLAKIGWDAAKSLGAMADEVTTTASIMGFTVREAEQFRFAMKRAGGDIRTLERGMRMLSEEIESGGEKLIRLGVDVRDTSTGAMLPMSRVMLQITDRLAAMKSTTERNVLAVKLFGRSGLALVDDLAEVSEGVRRADELMVGMTEEQVRKFSEYQKQVADLEAQWERLKVSMKHAAAATVIFFLKDSTGREISFSELERMGANVAAWKPKTRAEQLAAAEAAGFDMGRVRSQEAATQAARLWAAADEAGRLSLGKAAQERIRAAWGMTKEGIEAALKQTREDLAEARRKLFEPGISDSEVAERHSEAQRLTVREGRLQAQLEQMAEAKKQAEAYSAALKKLNATIAEYYTRGGLKDIDRTKSPLYTDTLSTTLAGFDVERGWMAAMMGRFGGFGPRAQDEALEAQLHRLGTLPEDRERADAERLASIRAYLSHQERMVQLIAGPGGEVDAIQKAYALRIQAANETFTIERDMAAYKREVMDAEYRREEDLAALRRRGLEEYKNSVMSAFDALVARGSGGIGAFVKSQGMGVMRTMVGNLAGMMYQPGRFSLPGLGTAESPSTLGKLMQGTPFGMDPAAAQLTGAGMKLTGAGVQLEIAANALMGAASIGAGGGAMARTDLSEYFASLGAGGGAPSKNAGLYKALGIGGGAAAGAFGAYSGFKAGGAQGALTGTASILGTAGMLLPMLSKSLSFLGPVGMIAGMGLGLAASFLGDPKQKRAEELQREAEARRYSPGTGGGYDFDIYGRKFDYDYRGGMRPIVVQNTYNVRALDVQSFVEWGKEHSVEFAEITAGAVAAGNAGELVGNLQEAMALK